MHVNGLSGILVFVSVLNLILGFITLRKAVDHDSAARFFEFTTVLALWVFCHGMACASGNLKLALFWTRAIMIGPIFLPYFLFRFAKALVGMSSDISKKISLMHWMCILLCLAFVPTPLLIKSVSFQPWGVAYEVGRFYNPWSIYFSITMVWSVSLLAMSVRKAQGLKRQQLLYVLMGITFALIFGSVFSIVLPLLGFGQLNRVGPTGTLALVGAFSYAIIKHHLMNISIIIRKTLIYSSVTSILVGGYLLIITIVTHLFDGLAGYQTVFSSAVAAALITLCFQPLRKRVQAFVDSKFFRQHVDREEKLYELSREVITHTTPEAVWPAALMRVLGESFHPKSGALYLRSRDGNGFTPMAFLGPNAPKPMEEDNPLVNTYAESSSTFPAGSSLRTEGLSQSTRDKSSHITRGAARGRLAMNFMGHSILPTTTFGYLLLGSWSDCRGAKAMSIISTVCFASPPVRGRGSGLFCLWVPVQAGCISRPEMLLFWNCFGSRPFFITSLWNLLDRKNRRRWLPLELCTYILSAILSVSVWIDHLFLNGFNRFSWGLLRGAGPLHPVFAILVTAVIRARWCCYRAEYAGRCRPHRTEKAPDDSLVKLATYICVAAPSWISFPNYGSFCLSFELSFQRHGGRSIWVCDFSL